MSTLTQATHSCWRRSRMWLFSCTGLAALSFVSGATPPHVPHPTTELAAPVLVAQANLIAFAPTTPVAAAPVNALDEPMRLIAAAQQAYAQVRDYSCVLVSKEKMSAQAPPEHVIAMQVRTTPFAVNLKWSEPPAFAGQEAVYVTGKNDNKMRVKSAGYLGALGFLTLEPTDARAQATSKHAITEAGLGNLIERYSKGWENERAWNLTEVKIGEYEFDKRRCIRVETTHPTNPDGRFLFYRSVIFFDKETKLPVRSECYAWPEKEGGSSELHEVFSYVNLQLNVGVSAEAFNK